MTAEFVRETILFELRAKGYAPNPSDVNGAVATILSEHKRELEVAAGESVEEAKKLASASTPLITVPSLSVQRTESSLKAAVSTLPAR